MEKNLENGNGGLKACLAIFVILTLALGGYLVYDKVLNKEEKNTFEKDSCNCNKEENNNKENNSSDPVKANELSVVTLTDTNQDINIGGKTYKVRYGANDVQGFLYINDVKVNPQSDNNDYYVYAEKAYVTSDFIIFTEPAQCEEYIVYVMDKSGNEVTVNTNGYQIKDLLIEDGILYATGYECPKEDVSYVKVSLKYQDYIFVVSPVK